MIASRRKPSAIIRASIHARITERDWQHTITELAHLLHYECYHVHDSRKVTSAGFPDVVLMRACPPRVLFAELKTNGGRLTKAQRFWLAGLDAAGLETHVWRPNMFDEIVRCLQQ